MPGSVDLAQTVPGCGESVAIIDRLANIMTWLREPDWTENVSIEWLKDWMNRRPIAELAMVAMLMPTEGQGKPDCGAFLWCCHVRGPDDVYAAPDYMTALAWSDAMNEINWKANSKLNIGDPTSFQDCLIKAVPAPWPHSAEAHAKNLPESMKGFALPSTDKTGAT